MRELETSLAIDAPAPAVWSVLVDLDQWPRWGPSVRSAELDGAGRRLQGDSHGTVTTAVGIRVPFRVTGWVPGACWSWHVAGLPATSHSVRRIDAGRCRLTFGVPWFAAPYLVVCRVALARIADLAVAG